MQSLSTLLPFILMFGLFYLIIFLPENKRKKKFKLMLDNLKVDDEVLTRGGIIGKIVNLQDNFMILQTGPDKVRIKLDRNAIMNVLNENSENNTES